MFFHRTALINQERVQNLEDDINYTQIYIKRTNAQFKELETYGTYIGAPINKHYRKDFENNMKSSLNTLETRLDDKHKKLSKLKR